MSHAGGFRGQLQHGRDFTVAEVFDVSHDENLAISVVQLIERFEKAFFKFAADGCGGRCEFAVGKLLRQVDRRLIAELLIETLFAIDRAPVGVMPPVQVNHPVTRQMPEPEMKWHIRRREVRRQSLAGFEQHILHDVAGVDPGGQASVETKSHQLAECFPMTFQQII